MAVVSDSQLDWGVPRFHTEQIGEIVNLLFEKLHLEKTKCLPICEVSWESNASCIGDFKSRHSKPSKKIIQLKSQNVYSINLIVSYVKHVDPAGNTGIK